MDPSATNVGQVMKMRYPLVVPRYQREYSWTEDQIQDFVSDIRRLMDAPPEDSHFFGSLVTLQRPDAQAPQGSTWEVIDGQQRLATFSLLTEAVLERASALSAELRASNEAEAANSMDGWVEGEREQRLLYADGGNPISGRNLRPRLTLSIRDAPFFSELVKGNRPTPEELSHRRMLDALETFSAALEEWTEHLDTPEQTVEFLDDLLRTLESRCTVINVVSSRAAEAYRVFILLNDRGLKLEDADLIRTHTLQEIERAGDAGALDRAVENWRLLPSDRPDEMRDFLRYFLTSRTGVRWPSYDLFGAYVREFLGSADEGRTPQRPLPGADSADALVNHLKAEWPVLHRLSDGLWPEDFEGEVDEWTKAQVKRLVKGLKSKASLPLLLSVAVEQGAQALSEVTGFLLKFIFRYTVCGGHKSRLGDLLYRAAAEVRRNPAGYGVDQIQASLNGLLRDFADDATFESKLRGLTYGRGTYLIKHLLLQVEENFAALSAGQEPRQGDHPAALDLDALTLEHVHPSSGDPRVPEMAEFRDRLGNLTLLTGRPQSELGNRPYTEKRDRYLTQAIAMTRDLAERHTEWKRPQYDARQRKLIAWALQLFAFPGAFERHGDERRVWVVRTDPRSALEAFRQELYDFSATLGGAASLSVGDILVPYASAEEGRPRHVYCVAAVGSKEVWGQRYVARFSRRVLLEGLPSVEGVLGETPPDLRPTLVPVANLAVLERLDGLLQERGDDVIGEWEQPVELGDEESLADSDNGD